MIILCPKCNQHKTTLAKGGKMCWDCFDQLEEELKMYKSLLGESQKNLFMMQASDNARHKQVDHLLDKLSDADSALLEISQVKTLEEVREIILIIKKRLREPIKKPDNSQTAFQESTLTK